MIWLNGQLVPPERAVVSVFDRGFLYGDGLFETLPVYDGIPFLLTRHLERLEHGLSALRFAQVPSRDELEKAVDDVIRASTAAEGTLRITVTRGSMSEAGLACSPHETPTRIVVMQEPRRYAAESYTNGVTLRTTGVRHISTASLPTRYKHANYLASILAFDEARAYGADEALVLNEYDRICEGAFSNVFLVRDGALYTPAISEGPLSGVVRSLVLELAEQLGVPAHQTELYQADVDASDEAFLTNSLAGVLPIRQICDVTLPAPGAITLCIAHAYAERVRAETGTSWPLVR